MRNSDSFSPAVIDRVAGLLDEFGAGDALTLSQLSMRTGLPRSSAHRLLTQLVEFGWITRRGQAYTLSRTMFEWGTLAQQHDGMHTAAHPILHELHATTGLVTHLAVLDGNDVRYLDKVGHGPIPLPSRVGGRAPALRTALGKALVAHIGAGHGRAALTSAASAAHARLRHEIADIRQRHIAHEREESVPQVACIAAPIGNSRTCVGAISVAGPVDQVDPVNLAMPIRAAAQAIWQSIQEGGTARKAG